MPRKIAAWLDKRSHRYYVRLGEVDPKTGKRRPLMLRDERGKPIIEGDSDGKTKALARLIDERDAAERRRTGPSVDDLVVAYLNWHKAAGSADRTIEGHTYHLLRFTEFASDSVRYGDRAASDISVRDLKRMREEMESRGNNAGYIAHLYSSVKACWAWAARPVEDRDPIEPMIAHNPFHRLPVPKEERGDEKFVPVRMQINLIRFAEERHPTVHVNGRTKDGLMILALKLVVLSGCRPAEAIGLRWDEIDWENALAKIPALRHSTAKGKRKTDDRRTHKTGKRTGKIRRIDIRPDVMKELKALNESSVRHPTWVFVVPNRKERPTSRRFGAWFNRLRAAALAAHEAGSKVGNKNAGVDLDPECTLYWFRHTFQSIGVRVLSAGDVAGLSGNSPEMVQSRYLHGEDLHVKDRADRLAEYRDELAKREEDAEKGDP
jgi:integrase